jgi:D-alanyl-D-alanine-carboxypeptidase/D-alanyl-D-alanine-endopeptidase
MRLFCFYNIKVNITKTFGAALLARAVPDKKVDLKDDIRSYLKEDYPNFNYNGMPAYVLLA